MEHVAYLMNVGLNLHLIIVSLRGSCYGAPFSSLTTLISNFSSFIAGLWMADLSVNQLLQEFVIEGERGVVNGVQNSLNMLMDVLKFTMVIVAPHIQTFGILIMISFSFIILGGLCFVYHVYRTDCGRTLRPATEEDHKIEVNA